MGYRQKNESAMRRYFPELLERIKGISSSDARDQRIQSIDVSDSIVSDDKSICISMADGRSVRLNSAYDPGHEAMVWFAGQEDIHGAYLMIFGLGNGAFAREIISHAPHDMRVLIYEPSSELFLKMLDVVDLTDFFSDRVRVIVEGVNEDLFLAVMEEMITYENYKDYQIYLTPRMADAFPESRETFVRHIAADGIGWMDGIIATLKCELHISPFNQIHNIRYLEEGTVVPRLSGVMPKDIPILLVGAGPSLADEIDVIKSKRDKVYVFAADSACPFLLKNDIVPDLYMSVEADRLMSYYSDDRMKDIPLIAKINTSYKLMRWHHGMKIFGYDEGFMQSFYKKFGVPQSQYRYGGNQMTALFAICDEMKIQTVIMVGQDMCYGADGNSHVDDNRGNDDDEKDIFYCENNLGERVKTRHDWFTFLRWYENAIQDCDIKHVINASLAGAKVQGATVMSLSDAIDKYGKAVKPFSEVLNKVPGTFAEKNAPDMDFVYDELYREIDRIEEIVSNDSRSEERKKPMIYGILRLYEMVNEEGSFEKSQRVGIEKIRECIKKAREM